MAGTCNTGTGVCTDPNEQDGVGCDDSNECTRVDKCLTGVCKGSHPVICTAQDECHVAGTCDSGTGVCSDPDAADGKSCDDGLYCKESSTCSAGKCGNGTAIVCHESPDIVCTADTCDESKAECSHDGASCGCEIDTDCPDTGDACTVNKCDPSTRACKTEARADGTACSDGNECTQKDVCKSGSCAGSDPVVCAALDQCHVAGKCDTGTGVCTDPKEQDGVVCDDSNACTQTDTCQGGSCSGRDPVVCAALDQCHVAGKCDKTTGVCTDPLAGDGTGCDDADACTQTDACKSGSCVGKDPVVCAALDQCHEAGTCNTSTGVCTDPNASNGTVCNDGNECTQKDACVSGSCAGSDPVV